MSDYVVDFLASRGIRHNFLVTGGAVVHLVDSTKKHPNMDYVCVQHEQFAAVAADGYFRAGNQIGVAMTTSGPGATNLATSICNAYFDSIPMICITGQVATFRIRLNKRLRQKGFQETDIESVFHSICKYVKLVRDPLMIRYELEKAYYLATHGRCGPVILDIPDDLQRVEIEPETLLSFKPALESVSNIDDQISRLMKLIKESDRPAIIVGAGIRAAQAVEAFQTWINFLNIPVFLTWGGADLLPFNHPLNMGCIGVAGSRGGNFSVQNADLIIALGTRLSQMITGGKQELFAPHAKKIMVDIDEEELLKFREGSFRLDLPIHADLNHFFYSFEVIYKQKPEKIFKKWRNCVSTWKERYPAVTGKDYQKKGLLNPHVFIQALSRSCEERTIVIADTGANLCWTMQAFEVKKNQKIFSAWNHTPMGYSLPASIGAAFATSEPIICLIGDGGLMMCVQELATLSKHNLPIKVFIFDNQGHATMKQTLEMWLNASYAAVDVNSGLAFPDYKKLAATFNLPYIHLKHNTALTADLEKIKKIKGPLICRLEIDPTYRIHPILKFGSGLEDLDPKLPGQDFSVMRHELSQIC